MDFLATAVWIWEFMILQLLPLVSVLLAGVFMLKIMDEAPETVGRYAKRMMAKFNRAGRGKQ
jgi:hypothetical protein